MSSGINEHLRLCQLAIDLLLSLRLRGCCRCLSEGKSNWDNEMEWKSCENEIRTKVNLRVFGWGWWMWLPFWQKECGKLNRISKSISIIEINNVEREQSMHWRSRCIAVGRSSLAVSANETSSFTLTPLWRWSLGAILNRKNSASSNGRRQKIALTRVNNRTPSETIGESCEWVK